MHNYHQIFLLFSTKFGDKVCTQKVNTLLTMEDRLNTLINRIIHIIHRKAKKYPQICGIIDLSNKTVY